MQKELYQLRRKARMDVLWGEGTKKAHTWVPEVVVIFCFLTSVMVAWVYIFKLVVTVHWFYLLFRVLNFSIQENKN